TPSYARSRCGRSRGSRPRRSPPSSAARRGRSSGSCSSSAGSGGWSRPMIDLGRPGPPRFDELTDSQARRIDQVCDGFETVWRSGRRPRIETFLEGCHGAARATLLHELILLEADYLALAGEAPEPDDYRRRFADFQDAWLDRRADHEAVRGCRRVAGSDG